MAEITQTVELYTTALFSAPVTGLLRYRVPSALAGAKLKGYEVISDGGPVGGDAVFDLVRNGASVHASSADRLKVLDGQTAGLVNTLDVAVAARDQLFLSLVSTPNAIGADLVLILHFVETVASGGGGLVSYYDPNRPPSVPHAKDDEFTGSALDAKWAIFQPTDLTVTVGDHLAKLQAGFHSPAAYKIQGIIQPVPTGDWTVMARLGIHAANVSGQRIGLMLLEDGILNPNTCDIVQMGMSYSTTAGTIVVDRHNDFSTSAAAATIFTAETLDRNFTDYCFKIVKVGTTYEFWISHSGLGWVRLASTAALGFVPKEFGIFANNNTSANVLYCFCDWFRVYAADPLFAGGERNVG